MDLIKQKKAELEILKQEANKIKEDIKLTSNQRFNISDDLFFTQREITYLEEQTDKKNNASKYFKMKILNTLLNVCILLPITYVIINLDGIYFKLIPTNPFIIPLGIVISYGLIDYSISIHKLKKEIKTINLEETEQKIADYKKEKGALENNYLLSLKKNINLQNQNRYNELQISNLAKEIFSIETTKTNVTNEVLNNLSAQPSLDDETTEILNSNQEEPIVFLKLKNNK